MGELIGLVYLLAIPVAIALVLGLSLELLRDRERVESWEQGAQEALEAVRSELQGLGPRPGVAAALERVDAVEAALTSEEGE